MEKAKEGFPPCAREERVEMSRGIRLLVVGIAIVFLSGMFAAWVSAQSAEPLSSPPVVPRSSGSSPKTHVVEVLTGLWCPPCGAADPGLGRVADEWAEDLVVIMYHCCATAGGTADTFWDTAVLTPRNNFYTWRFLPTMVVDGGGDYADETLFNIGSSGAAGTYNEVVSDLQVRADSTSNMYVELDGDLTQNSANVEVRVTATDPVTQTNLAVRTVLYEDALYGVQNNGPDVHRYVARAISEQPLVINQGETVTKTASFALNPLWNVNKLGVAAFVQSDSRVSFTVIVNGNPEQFFIADILNAARYDFTPRGILVYSDKGTTPDYVEDYEVLISTRNEYSFENWNAYVSGVDTGSVDDRSLPTAAELAEYPLVIWNTGATSTGVLAAGERTLLGDHLDSAGNLFISGSNLGFEAWTTYRSWFQQYLHAAFEGGNSGDLTISGVAGDPIGDSFSSQNLNVLADPDQINAVVQPGSAVPFRYSATQPASVRSQHDADSRLVYFGFQYFEGTDIWREGVMGQVILWIDGASGPTVDVLYPDGGEQVAQAAPITIRWYANDVVMAEDGIDLYFSENGGSSWQLIATGEPNDGRYAWTIPNIDSAQCRIRVVARDLSVESADGEAQSGSDFICGDPGFRITFTGADLGWRLVSFPTILADTTSASVLSSMAGSYRIVRAFNSASADPWKVFDPSRTAGDLQYIDNAMAFWIEVTAPGTLDLQGQKPAGTQYVPMRAGWNLVGFPSYQTTYTVAMLKADTGATRVEGFDASNIEYRLRLLGDTEVLDAGQGYWVFVPADTVWQVPA